MEHGLELIQSYPGNRWKFDCYNFLISWKYWKSSFSNFSYPGNTGNLIFSISGYPGNIGNIIFQLPHILEIFEIWFSWFFGFFQKRRAPKFHAECTGSWAEISHMRPIQGRKLKLFQTPISKWLGEIHLHAAARLHEDMLSLLHAAAWLHEDMFSFLFNILNTVPICKLAEFLEWTTVHF